MTDHRRLHRAATRRGLHAAGIVVRRPGDRPAGARARVRAQLAVRRPRRTGGGAGQLPGDPHRADAPIVVVRDTDGTLRGFVNVCRHRAHLVASGHGKRKALQCPYHAWTYGLDGCLRKAPRADHEPGFNGDDLSLVPVAVERLGPMLFANLDATAVGLPEELLALPARFATAGVELDGLRLRRRGQFTIQANWKTSLENYLECYHCPVAHPGLAQRVDVTEDGYKLVEGGLVASQYGTVRDSAFAGASVNTAQYHLLFPSTTFNIEAGPINLAVDITLPDPDPRRSRGFNDTYAPADVSDGELDELIAFANEVNDEDTSLVEGVREGLDSGLVPVGRLITNSEHQIAWFQRLMYETLSA